MSGKLDAINKDKKTITVDGKEYECLEKGFEYVEFYKIGDQVQLSFTPEGKVGMVAKVSSSAGVHTDDAKKSTDKATSNSENVSVKKKYMGVTVGMAVNNATQLSIAEKKTDAQSVVLKAIELLEEMERKGL